MRAPPQDDGKTDRHAVGVQVEWKSTCVSMHVVMGRVALKIPKTNRIHVPHVHPFRGAAISVDRNHGWRTQSRASPVATDFEAAGLGEG